MSVIHQKSENCWCGAGVNAEGSEQEVLDVCCEFRMRHRHREDVPRCTLTYSSLCPFVSDQCKCSQGVRETMGFDPRQVRVDEKEWERMAARQLGITKVHAFAGEPDRTDKNYAILVEGYGLVVLDGWGDFHGYDNKHPTVIEDPAQAEKRRAGIESLYARMGIERDVLVVEREVLTFITEWKYPGNGPVDLTP